MLENKGNIQEPAIEAVGFATRYEQPIISEFDTGSFAFENVGLSDILHSVNVQAMMDDFYSFAKISIGIVDIKGNILVVSGMQEICLKFHRAVTESCKFCIESDMQLATGISPGKVKEYRCKNNILNITTPIMIGNNHIGNLFLAQFLFNDEEVDDDLYRAQAKRFGYDETAYLAALDKIPRFSRGSIAAAVGFCSKLAQMLSNTNYKNVMLANPLTKYNHAIEKLKESEEKYRMIAENTSDEILVFGEDNTIRYVSPTYLHQLGYNEPEEFPLTPDSKHKTIHADGRDAVFSKLFYSIALKERGLIYTYRVKNKSGLYIWREDNANFKYDSAGSYTGSYVISRDITESKRAEEFLRASEEKYREIFDNVPGVFYSADLGGIVQEISPSIKGRQGKSFRRRL